MLDPLQASLRIAGAGMEAQSARLRVISENVANAQSTGTTAGADHPMTRHDEGPRVLRHRLTDRA